MIWYQSQMFLPSSNQWIGIGNAKTLADAVRDCWYSQFDWVCDYAAPIDVVKRMEWRIATIRGTNTIHYDPVPYDADFTDWRKSDSEVIHLWRCALESAADNYHEQPA